MLKSCIIIPNYNHGETIAALLSQLKKYDLPCFIIDDGSDQQTKQELEKAKNQFGWVTMITRFQNEGKGAAVLTGLKYALQHDYTHAIQIDADGQHNPNDIPKFLSAIGEHPNALIAGQPLFDQSIPKSRLYGRKLTNFWVSIETLSREINDAMCGFRAYPITLMRKIICRSSLGKGMNFDIEILVRSHWANIELISIPTKVTYPPEGISHFKPWKDNLEISWLHTRLFFGMLIRLPMLLQHHYKNKRKESKQNHWANINEKGCLIGLRFTLLCYKMLGRKFVSLLLYPIIGYFYCFNSASRKASHQYLKTLNHTRTESEINPAMRLDSSFKHFFSFGEMALDKLSVWNNDIKTDDIDFPNKSLFLNLAKEKQGAVIFTAHLGNIEIARSLSRFEPGIKINAIIFHKQAKKFNSVLEQINPEFKLNLIEVNSINIKLAIELKEKVDAGEFIVIVCDRISTSKPDRVVKAKFLGKNALFPQGPFILASLLQCPTYFMLCLKEPPHSYRIIFDEFALAIKLEKHDRMIQLERYAQKYAKLLELYCAQYPLQWFNFFDFWRPNE